jgi:hypothetical protein
MDALSRPAATAPVPEEQLAALREEIRRAGSRISSLRISLGLLLAAGVGGPLLSEVLVGHPPAYYANGQQVMMYLCFAVYFATGAGFASSYIAALHYRRRCAAQLRRYCSGHALDAVTDALSPLLRERGEHVWVARCILRDLSLPTELTPATTPTSRGDEPTPAADQ